jgi:hypothetical protein
MYGEKQSRDTWAGMMERPTSGTPKYLDSGNPGGRSRKFVAGGESGISGTDGRGQTAVCRVSGSSATVRYPQRAILRTNIKSLVGATAKQ